MANILRRVRWSFTLISIFMLLGCVATRPPATAVDELLGYSDAMATLYYRDQEWWRAYHDPQLNALVDDALLNNLDYLQASVSINKALARAGLAGSDLWPFLASEERFEATKDLRQREGWNKLYSAGLSVNYEVDLWRRLADKAAARDWDVRASQLDRDAARLSIIDTTVDLYFKLMFFDAALKVLGQSIEHHEKINSITQMRHAAGKVDSLELEQAESQLIAVRTSKLEMKTQREKTLQLLRITLNLPPDSLLELSVGDFTSILPLGVDLKVPVAVLAERPDLKAAQYRLQAAFKEVNAARKLWLPTISLASSLTGSNEHVDDIFRIPFLAGGVALTLPFLDWNRVRWQIRGTEAEYDDLKIEYEKILNIALNELNLAYNSYMKEEAILQNIKIRLTKEQKISEYYKNRFLKGNGLLSDWLKSLLEERQAFMDVLDAHYRMLSREILIYKSLSGRYTSKQNCEIEDAN